MLRILELDKLISELKPLEDRVALIDTIMVGKTFWLYTLSELSHVLPHNMWITSITPQFIPAPLLKIDGKIDCDFKDIEAFQKTLDSSIVFVGDIVMGYKIMEITIKNIKEVEGQLEQFKPVPTQEIIYLTTNKGILEND